MHPIFCQSQDWSRQPLGPQAGVQPLNYVTSKKLYSRSDGLVTLWTSYARVMIVESALVSTSLVIDFELIRTSSLLFQNGLPCT